jgi:hypothetical protein
MKKMKKQMRGQDQNESRMQRLVLDRMLRLPSVADRRVTRQYLRQLIDMPHIVIGNGD